jgi:hypothetical protein
MTSQQKKKKKKKGTYAHLVNHTDDLILSNPPKTFA